MTQTDTTSPLAFLYTGTGLATFNEPDLERIVAVDGEFFALNSEGERSEPLCCETGLARFPENVPGRVTKDAEALIAAGIIALPDGISVEMLADDAADENCDGGIVFGLYSSASGPRLSAGWGDVEDYLPTQDELFEVVGMPREEVNDLDWIERRTRFADASTSEETDLEIARVSLKALCEFVVAQINSLLQQATPTGPYGQDGAEVGVAEVLDEIAREALASGDQNILDLAAGLSDMLGLGDHPTRED